MAVLLRVLRMFLTVIVLRPGLVPIRPLALIVIVTRPDLAPIRPLSWVELMGIVPGQGSAPIRPLMLGILLKSLMMVLVSLVCGLGSYGSAAHVLPLLLSLLVSSL